MSDLESYVRAVKVAQTAQQTLRDMAETLKEFQRAFSNDPESVCFIGLSEEDPPLPQIMEWAHKEWDIADFPSPERIQAAIRHLLLSKKAMHDAWDKVPEEFRGAIRPPATSW